MIEFLPLGGAQEIGSSCFYLNVDGTGFILDCGMHPRKFGAEALPLLDLVKDREVDFGLISHAHQDHIGALPYLVQKYPYIRLFSTPQTRAIAELTLHNSVSILKENLREEGPVRPYTHEEIDLLIQSINYQEYDQPLQLKGYRQKTNEPVNVSFSDAGHILGSAGIMLNYRGRNIFYTGDINLDNQALISGALLPDAKIDTLLLECTYGSTDSSLLLPWWEEAKNLAAKANKVLEGGGSILIPVFSLGKMQEMLATLWKLMQTNILTKTDIYTGGIGKKINIVHDRNRFVTRRSDRDIILSDIDQKDIYETESLNIFRNSPSIVLAPSGMVIEGTLSHRLALEWIKHEKFAIFIVGYIDKETPGYQLYKSEKGMDVQLTREGKEQKVRCDINRFRFSSHSKREELVDIVRKLKPERVVLIHGDESAIDWMGYSILKLDPSIKVHASESGKPIIF